MNDRVSRLVLTFDGEAGTIDQVLSGIKTSVKSAVADMQRTSSQIDLFGDISRNLPAVQAALDSAKSKVAAFRAEIDQIKSTGAVPIKALTDGLAAAEKAAASAQKEFSKQTSELAKLDVQLKAAKIDTSNLTAEQTKLATATKAAADAAAQQAAKQLLGIKTIADIQPQITKINAAFETLRASGTLSAREITIAQQALAAKIRETQGEVTKLGSGLSQAIGPEASSLISGFATKFLGVTAVLGTVATGFKVAIDAANQYRNELAQIDTVTNLSKSQLDALGQGARELARDLGIDLGAAMKGLFDLIRSGIPPENALTVLKTSAEAAKAAMVDTSVGVKAANTLVDSFNVDIKDLGGAFDILADGAKNGGATLNEFASDATGALGNVARAAKIPFQEVISTLTVMVDKSGDAAGSIAALTKIIVGLNTKAAREQLRGLGIETTGLIDTFRELGKRDIGIDRIVDLGIVSKKSAGSILSLTNNTDDLTPALERAGKAAGTVATQIAKIDESPQGKLDKLLAAIKESSVATGKRLTSDASTFVPELTEVVKASDKLAIAENRVNTSVGGISASLTRYIAGLRDVVPAQQSAADSAREMARFAAQAAAGLDTAGKAAEENKRKITEANAALEASVSALQAEVQALQAASTRDVGDINARAEAEIAALDKSAQATAATAARTLEIQIKAAADRLAVIQKSEAEITDAINASTAAREALQRQAGVDERKIAADTAKARIDALAPVLAQYQAHYNALIALAQSYQAKINAIAQERDSFTDAIRQRNQAIAAQGQNALDQYASNLQEIDRLISASAEAAARGEAQRARQLTDEAIARSATIKEVIGRDGEVIIGKYEAIATATNRTKKAEDGYLTSLDQQDDAAKAGYDATQKGIDAVKPKLEDLKATYDALKSSVDAGLLLSVTLDEKKVADARAAIDELTKPREIPITFRTPGADNNTPAPPAGGFARGGLVGEWAQRFAGGGSVFRRPLWNKVPGSGSGDTVPAALSSGSYVIRKAASQHYGDGLLGKLARGFAFGGGVGFTPGPPQGDQFKALHELKVEAQTEFQKILDRATGLPHPGGPGTSFGGGQDVRDFVKRVLEIIAASQDADQIKSLLDRVLVYYNRFDPAIEDAQEFHVPLVMGAFSSGPDDSRGVSSLFKRLSTEMTRGRFFAAGGPAGRDTVPAWLTPGEHVIQPRAVAMYGGGFMDALNNMRIPRAFLDNVLNFPAPRPTVGRFATGGPVGGVVPGGSSVAAKSGGGDTHIHHWHIDGSDLLSEETVRRKVIPVLDKIKRRGGAR